MTDVTDFYDLLSDDYHLIFADWHASIERQAAILDDLLRAHLPTPPSTVLDCACGIGTQALGLVGRGYTVHATDISPASVARARQEAASMGRPLTTGTADMRTLAAQVSGPYDAVIAFDNALPHLLSDDDLHAACTNLYAVTKPGGAFFASIRDYDALLQDRPEATSHRVMHTPQGQRITFQVWDWDDDLYTVTQFIVTPHGDSDWAMRHFTTRYRALQRGTLSAALQAAGFSRVNWQMPAETGFYQPVVVAHR